MKQEIENGTRVTWIDNHKVRYGKVIAYGRSSHNPRRVYIVKPEIRHGHPITTPNGGVIHVVEVHADRFCCK